MKQGNQRSRSSYVLHSKFEASLEYLTPCLKSKQKKKKKKGRMTIDVELRVQTGSQRVGLSRNAVVVP